MNLKWTSALCDLLKHAAEYDPDMRKEILQSSDSSVVEWDVVKKAQSVLRAHGQAHPLTEVCKGSCIALEAPAKREVSIAFKKILESRRKAAKQAEYDSLVSDITKKQKSAQDAGFLPTTRLQIGQGVHHAVTMGLGYAMGTAAANSLDVFGPATKHLGGVIGLIIALIFETVLYITRATMAQSSGDRHHELLDPEKYAKARAKPVAEGEAFETTPGGAPVKQIEPKKQVEPKKKR